MNEPETIYTLPFYERGARFDWNGSLAKMDWYGDKTKPTQKQLDALWPDAENGYWEQVKQPIRQARHDAYIADADPVFFQWQRGDATEQEWLDAVQDVKDANPYPNPA